MKGSTSVDVQVGGETITFESGVLAQQAAGSVLVKLGDTIMFSAATTSESPRPGMSYFPLQVEYREKFYAAGRFPGGFFKREARPSEKEVITARLTDRPLRPLFPETYRNDVQINNMLLSFDGEHDSDVLSITAASASLVLSELPFYGPIGSVRVGRVNGEFVINPTNEQRLESDLDLIYAGTKELPMMIEGDASEMAEADLIAAMKAAQAEVSKLVDAQLELRRKLGLPDKPAPAPEEDTEELLAAREICGAELEEALLIPEHSEHRARLKEIKQSLNETLLEKFPEMTADGFNSAFDKLEVELVHKNALEKGRRADGRGFDDLREITAEVGVLPRTHGSALFNRGETQALTSITLGTASDAQRMDAIVGGPEEKRFLVHYNFPPYCVGEAGRLGFTSRREMGHGALAERSLRRMIPDDCLYTIRLVSDIMGSNGSSSMATVCAGSLALMDAGIPLKRAVAGIAIGLFSGDGKAKVTVDIAGEEDHCGEMDFKVAGTRDGITGFQVDLKRHGLEWELVEEAFGKARKTRLELLDRMDTVLSNANEELSKYAPRITQIKINPEKIGDVIGPGGKVIRRITEMSGAQIDIDNDGSVNIFAKTPEAMDMAVEQVQQITAEVKEGQTYEGKVVNIMPFGAFVEVLPGKDGLVHISELADSRVEKVEEVCKIGDVMRVKCIGVDDRGRVRLSRRAAMKDE